MSLKNLYIGLPVGQSVRDFLVLGIVDHLLKRLQDFRLVILSPSYNVPEFLQLCPQDDRVVVQRMELPKQNPNQRLVRWRLKLRSRPAIRALLKFEAARLKLPDYLEATLREFPPSLFVSTHPKTSYEYSIVMWARRHGVQTLGVVKSWDNVGKGLSSQPNLLTVWSPVNKREAVELLKYRPNEVEVKGGPSFDPYYSGDYRLPKAVVLKQLGLDPERPVITLATGGVMDRGLYGRDETHLVDDLQKMIEESDLLRSAQLVIRLHPHSRLEFFWNYLQLDGVKVSFTSYLPGLGWCPRKGDLLEQIGLLAHSTVIVTPASSWVLEAAIFNTPTVVPVYSDRQPDHAAAQFDSWTLVRHFKPLVENDWVPVTRSYDETKKAIEDAFTQPEKYAQGRKAIVDNYIFFQDGNSCERVVEWIAGIAENLHPGAPKGF